MNVIKNSHTAGGIIIEDGVPASDLAESPLAGKVLYYKYHSGVAVTPRDDARVDYMVSVGQSVKLIFGKGVCTWVAVGGQFDGETATSPCGQKKIIENIYLVTWLENNQDRDIVTMVINLDAKTVNSSYSSYFFSNGALEFLQAEITDFRDQE